MIELEKYKKVLSDLNVLKKQIKSYHPFTDDHRYFRETFPRGYGVEGFDFKIYNDIIVREDVDRVLDILKFIRTYSQTKLERLYLKRIALIHIKSIIKYCRYEIKCLEECE